MDHRHRLLVFELMGQRGAIRVAFILLLLLITAGGDLYWSFLGSRRPWLWALCGLVGGVLCYYHLWLRRAAVYVRPDHLLVQGFLLSVRLSYTAIASVTSTQISQQYPSRYLHPDEGAWLMPFYARPCLLVEMEAAPLPRWAYFLWFPSLLVTSQGRGVLLIVSDATSLNQAVEAARTACLQQQSQSPRPKSGNASLPPAPSSALRILLVENNPARRIHLQRLLQTHYRVATAVDGIDGLRQARDLHPDLILTAASLPRLGSLALLKAIRHSPVLHDRPVIFLAAQTETDVERDALQAGANDFLLYPVDDEILALRVHIWLQKRIQEQKLYERNERLHTQLLNQMAELVRRGELLNFLPETVAQNVMSGQISRKIEPFRRQKVTILFVDIVGFTQISGRLEPQTLAELLNEYLREMTATAIQYDGTVDKFVGDGVMVLFGAPQYKDEVEQAWEAVQTAVAMHQAVRKIGFIWEKHLLAPLQVRIGINTGYCTAGVFGNELLQNYTVVGSAVNIASRLQTAAEPAATLCSAETYSWISDRVEARPLGKLTLRGVAHPVEAYKIAGLLE